MSRPIRFSLAALLLSACTVGPDYQTPQPLQPEAFRGAASSEQSFADLEWFQVFQDPALQALVRTALQQNFDARLAAERVLEARARYTVINSNHSPDLDAFGQQNWNRTTGNGPTPLPPGVGRSSQQTSIGLSLSWDLDFWGRFDRATEAARAELLASEYGRVAVLQSLVTDLALTYFDLLESDAGLAIAQRTLASREKSAELVSLRLEQGVANKVELRQAENLVLTSLRLIPELEQLQQQQENLIRVLVGSLPGPVERGSLDAQSGAELKVPAGLPSQLLERRPDIHVAELRLIAANARIGEARAMLYPNVSLTSSVGGSSEQLTDLLRSGSGTWQLLPSISLPIFNGGRLEANVEVTESQQRQAALEYLATLQQAFRQVADALVEHDKTREIRLVQQSIQETLADQLRLSQDRYRGGVTSYLEVLDTERDHFDAELSLVQARRAELSSTVVLYRALGGGWQGTAEWAAIGPQDSPKAGGDTSGD